MAVAFVTLVCLVPIWGFEYFPSVDGPVHLSLAQAILEINGGDPLGYGEYLVLAGGSISNFMSHGLLAVFMLVVPPLLAEKLLLTLYVLGMIAAIYYAARAVSGDPVWVTLLGVPFIYSYPFLLGFYNFCLGLIVFLVASGYLLRRRRDLSPRDLLILGVLGLIGIAAHPTAAANIIIYCGTVSLSLALRQMRRRRGDPWPDVWKESLKGPATLAVAFLPTLLILFNFAAGEGVGVQGGGPADLPVRLRELGSMTTLVALHPMEYAAAIPIGLCFAFLSARAIGGWLRAGRGSVEPELLVAAAVFLSMFLVGPQVWGRYWLDRLMPYLFLTLLLWLGALPFMRGPVRIASVVVTVCFVTLTGSRLSRLDDLNGLVREYVAPADLIEPGSTILPVRISVPRTESGRQRGFRIDPLRHASGYIAVRRKTIDLNLYQAKTDYFPVEYRGDRDPFQHISGSTPVGTVRPDLRFIDYHERTGGRVDYVHIWGDMDAWKGDPHVESLRDQLEAGYEPVWSSSVNRRVTLYRRVAGRKPG